jgi:GLPGLI family protein
MISEACIKKVLGTALFLFLTAGSFTQISSGRIVFERKTNLKKRLGDNPRMKNFITEENKYRIENFELIFNDSMCVFRPLEDDEPDATGFMKYLTTRNTVYQNLAQREKTIFMDLWGTEAIIKDSLDARRWKITESKRNISGYNCRKAIWEINDSTRVYAWYALDIVPSFGPEGFEGLPGAILGMATEDGSVVYFAKEVKASAAQTAMLQPNTKGKEVFTEEQLKGQLMQRMGQWVKPRDIELMFLWL